jgi:hypothetical protein
LGHAAQADIDDFDGLTEKVVDLGIRHGMPAPFYLPGVM